MIRSMTGYGKHTEKTPHGDITVEIKTLNHKSLSVICNPFNGYFLMEEKINAIMEGKLFRGKVFVKITRDNVIKKNSQRILINEDAAAEYVKKIKKLQKNLGLKGEMAIGDVMSFPGVIESVPEKKEEKKLWPYINKAVLKACTNLVKFREKEGSRLVKDFKLRIRIITKNIRDIEKYQKQSVAAFRKRLSKLHKDVMANAEPDKSRVESEIASFAKNCDITEEVIRMAGHLATYKEIIEKKQFDVGKKLDFIAQEMQREANTIGAKSEDFRISKAIIDVKSEIEKMREQVRNIE